MLIFVKTESVEYTEILTDIRKIVRSINLESKRIQKEYGISIPQLLCLNYLKRQPGYKATHGQITRSLDLNTSTVTGIIDRLAKKDLVVKAASADDRRVLNIVLTAQGNDVLNNTPVLLHEQLTNKLKMLSQEEIKKLKESLALLIKLLEIEDIKASPVITIEERLGGAPG